MTGDMAILTISREYGSGAEEIGRAVAERTGYDFVDKERIFQDMKAAGERWERLGQELDEACPTVWERYDWEYRGFIALVESYIYEYAARDRVVIVGRGSNFLLHDVPYALRVRMVAPLEDRIKRVMLQERLDRETAGWLIHKMDRERDGFAYAAYGKSWSEERHYDMTFNTAIEPSEGVADSIVDALIEKDRMATPEAREWLARRALAAKVKARIATDVRLFLPTLEVSHDEHGIILKAIIHNATEHHLAEQIAREVAGTTPVRFELHHRA